MKPLFFLFAFSLTLTPSLQMPSLQAAEKNPYFFTQGDPKSDKIAFTFDDGPGPNTLKVLDILDQHKVKATFFMNGDQVKLRPQIAREVKKRGHQIADHTYSHMNFYAYQKKHGVEKAQNKIENEIELSKAELEKITGEKITYCRMPHGFQRNWMRNVADKFDYTFVNWTFGEDWLKIPQEKMEKDYLRAVKSGAIILMHDGGKNRDKTLAILPALIAQAQKKNLKLCTVAEILQPLKSASQTSD